MGRALIGCCPVTTANQSLPHSGPILSPLVKVGGNLREILHCDYVAVIDSEGLMSRTKVDGTDFDNELSTLDCLI